MPGYDAAAHEPPAPVALVAVRSIDGGAVASDVPLLIDTGADATLLPRSMVLSLGLTPDPTLRIELAGFDGTRTTADTVEVDVLFLNKAFRGRYLLIDGGRGILGRDVLNSLRLAFDGPRQEWTEFRPRA